MPYKHRYVTQRNRILRVDRPQPGIVVATELRRSDGSEVAARRLSLSSIGETDDDSLDGGGESSNAAGRWKVHQAAADLRREIAKPDPRTTLIHGPSIVYHSATWMNVHSVGDINLHVQAHATEKCLERLPVERYWIKFYERLIAIDKQQLSKGAVLMERLDDMFSRLSVSRDHCGHADASYMLNKISTGFYFVSNPDRAQSFMQSVAMIHRALARAFVPVNLALTLLGPLVKQLLVAASPQRERLVMTDRALQEGFRVLSSMIEPAEAEELMRSIVSYTRMIRGIESVAIRRPKQFFELIRIEALKLGLLARSRRHQKFLQIFDKELVALQKKAVKQAQGLYELACSVEMKTQDKETVRIQASELEELNKALERSRAEVVDLRKKIDSVADHNVEVLVKALTKEIFEKPKYKELKDQKEAIYHIGVMLQEATETLYQKVMSLIKSRGLHFVALYNDLVQFQQKSVQKYLTIVEEFQKEYHLMKVVKEAFVKLSIRIAERRALQHHHTDELRRHWKDHNDFMLRQLQNVISMSETEILAPKERLRNNIRKDVDEARYFNHHSFVITLDLPRRLKPPFPGCDNEAEIVRKLEAAERSSLPPPPVPPPLLGPPQSSKNPDKLQEASKKQFKTNGEKANLLDFKKGFAASNSVNLSIDASNGIASKQTSSSSERRSTPGRGRGGDERSSRSTREGGSHHRSRSHSRSPKNGRSEKRPSPNDSNTNGRERNSRSGRSPSDRHRGSSGRGGGEGTSSSSVTVVTANSSSRREDASRSSSISASRDRRSRAEDRFPRESRHASPDDRHYRKRTKERPRDSHSVDSRSRDRKRESTIPALTGSNAEPLRHRSVTPPSPKRRKSDRVRPDDATTPSTSSYQNNEISISKPNGYDRRLKETSTGNSVSPVPDINGLPNKPRDINGNGESSVGDAVQVIVQPPTPTAPSTPASTASTSQSKPKEVDILSRGLKTLVTQPIERQSMFVRYLGPSALQRPINFIPNFDNLDELRSYNDEHSSEYDSELLNALTMKHYLAEWRQHEEESFREHAQRDLQHPHVFPSEIVRQIVCNINNAKQILPSLQRNRTLEPKIVHAKLASVQGIKDKLTASVEGINNLSGLETTELNAVQTHATLENGYKYAKDHNKKLSSLISNLNDWKEGFSALQEKKQKLENQTKLRCRLIKERNARYAAKCEEITKLRDSLDEKARRGKEGLASLRSENDDDAYQYIERAKEGLSLDNKLFKLRSERDEMQQKLQSAEQSNMDRVTEGVYMQYKELTHCPTCQSRVKDCALTKCYHMFCQECVAQLYKNRNRRCPICNVRIGLNEYKRVYL